MQNVAAIYFLFEFPTRRNSRGIDGISLSAKNHLSELWAFNCPFRVILGLCILSLASLLHYSGYCIKVTMYHYRRKAETEISDLVLPL